MEDATYYKKIKVKENLDDLDRFDPSTRNRITHFIFSHTIVAACILTFTVSASAYVGYQKSPEFRRVVKNAVESVKQAVSPTLRKFLKPDYSKLKADVILSRGNALRAQGQFEDAGDAFKASLEKFTLNGDNLGLGKTYTEMGILSTQTKKYESAQKQFQQALTYFTWAESPDGLGYANHSLGQLHYVQEYFHLAEKYFLKSEDHFKESGDQVGLGNVAVALGNIYIATNQVPKAIHRLLEAEKLFKLGKSNLGLVNAYNALGRASQSQGTRQGF